MKGKVKFFNHSKGFGFIIADDGTEYFVHISGINGKSELNENTPVTFDIGEGKRGPIAQNVSVDNE